MARWVENEPCLMKLLADQYVLLMHHISLGRRTVGTGGSGGFPAVNGAVPSAAFFPVRRPARKPQPDTRSADLVLIKEAAIPSDLPYRRAPDTENRDVRSIHRKVPLSLWLLV